MTPKLTVDPAGLERVAAALESIATRLERAVTMRTTRLAPSAAGNDEVSERVAASLDAAARAFRADVVAGAGQAVGAAAALREHARALAAADGAHRP